MSSTSHNFINKSRKRSAMDFQFYECIGEGSYSKVYKALSIHNHRTYAVKILSKSHIQRENKRKYVNIEKDTLNILGKHPGIVTLYYTFQDEKSLYFVIDFAKNGELLSLIRKLGSLSENLTKYYMTQLIDALDFIHSKGIIHRDLKPENILLNHEWKLMITDFGAAKILNEEELQELRQDRQIGANTESGESSRSSTRTGSFVGTAEYVSPELLKYNMCGFECDLWAMGCILYQLLAGKPPFKGATEYLTFEKIIALDYRFPDFFISPQIKDIITNLLILIPENRYKIDDLKNHPWLSSINWQNKESIWKSKAPKLEAYNPRLYLMQQGRTPSNSTIHFNNSAPAVVPNPSSQYYVEPGGKLTSKMSTMPQSVLKRQIINAQNNPQLMNKVLSNRLAEKNKEIKDQLMKSQNSNDSAVAAASKVVQVKHQQYQQPPHQQIQQPPLLHTRSTSQTPSEISQSPSSPGTSRLVPHSPSCNFVAPTPSDIPSPKVKSQNSNDLQRIGTNTTVLTVGSSDSVLKNKKTPRRDSLQFVSSDSITRPFVGQESNVGSSGSFLDEALSNIQNLNLKHGNNFKQEQTQKNTNTSSHVVLSGNQQPKQLHEAPNTPPVISNSTFGNTHSSPKLTYQKSSGGTNNSPRKQPRKLSIAQAQLSEPINRAPSMHEILGIPRPNAQAVSAAGAVGNMMSHRKTMQSPIQISSSQYQIQQQQQVINPILLDKHIPKTVTKKLMNNEYILKLDNIFKSELLHKPNQFVQQGDTLDDNILNTIINENYHHLNKDLKSCILIITSMARLLIYEINSDFRLQSPQSSTQIQALDFYSKIIEIKLTNKNVSMYDYEFDEELKEGYLILELMNVNKLIFLSAYNSKTLVKGGINSNVRVGFTVNDNVSWIDALLRAKELLKQNKLKQQQQWNNNTNTSSSSMVARPRSRTPSSSTTPSNSTPTTPTRTSSKQSIAMSTSRNVSGSMVNSSAGTRNINNGLKPSGGSGSSIGYVTNNKLKSRTTSGNGNGHGGEVNKAALAAAAALKLNSRKN